MQGVGLAANQVGVDLKVFVYDCADDDGVRHVGVVCNPVLDELPADERVLDDNNEGCLSVPTAYAELARPDVAVRGLDSQFVVAAAIGFGIGGKGNGGIALVTNRRGGDEDGYRTLAQVSGGTMDVANLVLDSKASADIKSLAVGAAVGGSFAAGGSVVTNIVDGDVAYFQVTVKLGFRVD